ncbi:DUF5134 domain-containing protein [Arthrobacter globiformis]|uniref:DUF5134 domain-containing protein n=1 Tax=Arthrobacter globiformis TaxID=1665 RepID=UPI0027D8496D|nr:DUF5134 domain-containing protein [Arthrobacter globiformis]
MFNIPALTWTLTAVLLAGGSYHLWQAARSHHLTDRVNNTLHALMNALMAAMLWNLAPSTTLAQIGLLAAAALWFIIQAVARPEFKLLCAGTQGRLKCAYHALTMAAAALMIAMMTHPTTSPAPANGSQADGMPDGMSMTMPHSHHAMTAAPHNTAPDTATAAAAAYGHAAPAILLTVFFAAAAATFLTLLLRRRAMTNSAHHQAATKHSTRTEHALEALGATTMALMFATMTA